MGVLCILLQHLQSKAEQRNPDEFYFAMEKAQTKDGVHIQRCADSLQQRPALEPIQLHYFIGRWIDVNIAVQSAACSAVVALPCNLRWLWLADMPRASAVVA
jgi:hypothetical protein